MNVLVPFDVEPVSERAIKTALEMFGGQEDVHMIAVHISTGEDTPAEIVASEVKSMGEESDVSVEADIRPIESEVESKPAIRKAITDIVEAEDIDLVVLGHEEKSLFDQVFRSDTSERLLKTHEIPVLLVP